MKIREVERDIPLIGYTVEEAAIALRIHPQTISRLFREGVIPAKKTGKGWLVHPDALEEWLKTGPSDTKLQDDLEE